MCRIWRLQDRALGLLVLRGLRAGIQHSADGLVEDALQVALGERRALQVLVRLDLPGAYQGLLVGHGLHSLLPQGLESRGVFSQIELGADEDNGDVGRVVVNLGVPLGLDVVKRRRADDGEADEEDVGLGVRQRPQPVVIFLSRSVPESQADGLAIDHDTRRVVVEDCRDVLAGKGVGGV